MPGRIETYIHSDSITQNKGGALVKVTCDTDFAAKTTEFIEFTKRVALCAYAWGMDTWASLSDDEAVGLEDQRLALAKTLKENIVVTEIAVLKL